MVTVSLLLPTYRGDDPDPQREALESLTTQTRRPDEIVLVRDGPLPPANRAVIEAIAEDAEARNLSYPDNYVLSEWDDNRMYNYVVNGEAESYCYARNQSVQFLGRTDPAATYQQYSNRVGYVVVTDVPRQLGEAAMGARLLGTLDADTQTVPPLAHYRLLYVDDDRSIAAYALVPGARITGQAEGSGQVVTVETTVDVDGETLTYERSVTASGDGGFTVRVPYAGEYAVGGQPVTDPESAVTNGTAVSVG